VGVIDDAARTIDMALKTPGNLLYLIGETRNELAGSHFAEVIDQDSFRQFFAQTDVPQVDITRARATMQALGEAIRSGLVSACHDLSEGGLAVAAAEMALASLLGATIEIEHISLQQANNIQANTVRLFSESPSRFLVEITPEQLGMFEQHMHAVGIEEITYVGTVTAGDRFIVRNGAQELINLSVAQLQESWKGGKA
jgi:phosphoribosylformylglycinamidine synthase